MTLILDETDSTNNYMKALVAGATPLAEGSVVAARCQSAGRGQMGNRWESAPGQNLTFSIYFRPTFLAARRQFALSEVASLAVVETLDGFLPGFSIKWPNDIYHGHRKVCGMLVENTLAGRSILHSVVGIGINLNQTVFEGDAPNPVSVKTLLAERGAGCDIAIGEVMDAVTARMMALYGVLRAGGGDVIHRRYERRLYRRDGLHEYVDVATQQPFRAALVAVEPEGALRLRTEAGDERRYMFKEVKFRLPSGIVKE